ncbi:MAG: hypothetical protein WBZ32_15430 [Candidatus Acidiferrales bacterium]
MKTKTSLGFSTDASAPKNGAEVEVSGQDREYLTEGTWRGQANEKARYWLRFGLQYET